MSTNGRQIRTPLLAEQPIQARNSRREQNGSVEIGFVLIPALHYVQNLSAFGKVHQRCRELAELVGIHRIVGRGHHVGQIVQNSLTRLASYGLCLLNLILRNPHAPVRRVM